MITLHGSCKMCGGLVASVEVDVPHATPEHRRAAGVTGRGVMCTALCKTCVRAAVAAWTEHGAGEWEQKRAEVKAAKAKPGGGEA